MAIKNITEGDKFGYAKEARLIESKKGTAGIEVQFEFEEPSTKTTERLSWIGWLSANSLEFTMDILVNVLGFNGDDSIDDNGFMSSPDVLDWKRQVKLVVENNEYEGRTFPKIKYVNAVGGSNFQKCDVTSVKSKLQQVGFKAAFLAAKQKVPF